MSRYAEGTDVSTDKSRSEIERTLQRYGATSFAYGWDAAGAAFMFEAHDRRIKFVLPLPDRDAFALTPSKRQRRSPAQQQSAWEQACRQSYRALALVIKAKLEAVAAGISEFEDEFLAHVMLPSGRTVGQEVRPRIDEAYATGKMPALLPGGGS